MIRFATAALYLTLAAAPALARSVELDIDQQASGKSQQTQKLVLEVGDTMCASVQLRGAKVVRAVKVCPDKTGFNVELHLDDVDLEAHAGNAVGQRVVLGRFERPDGSRLEVALTPR
jgi:hypothetical protein